MILSKLSLNILKQLRNHAGNHTFIYNIANLTKVMQL